LLAQYVPAFHPSFLGLYADEKTIAATAKDFKVFYAKQPGRRPTATASTTPPAAMPSIRRASCALLLRHGETPGQRRRRPQALLAGK
jgi:protein SCO1/2